MSPVRNKNNGAGAGDGVGVSVVGMSNLGNTSGTTGTVASQILFAGGNNITLSQSINGSSATITISAGAGVGGNDTLGISNLGNTSGTSGTINGTALQFILAGGNNITLSQSINGSSATITISGINTSQGSDTMGISNLGNTSGTSGTINGSNVQLILAGGNNITLSQSVNGSSATITISGINTSQGSDTMGISNLGNTSGTSGTINGSNVQLILAGGNNITLSQSLNGASGTITISAANAGITESMQMTHNFYGATDSLGTNQYQGTVWIMPWHIPHKFTCSYINHLILMTTTNSAFQATQGIGIYTRNGSSLSLASSVSQTFGFTNTTQGTLYNNGMLLLTQNATWNMTPGNYWLGIHYISTGTGTLGLVKISGIGGTAAIAGIGVTNGTYTFAPGWGVYGISHTTGAPKQSIAFTDIAALSQRLLPIAMHNYSQ